MKWLAQRRVHNTRETAGSRSAEAVWERWFAWYPVAVANREHSYWVWLEFVERKWGRNRYSGRRKRRYRLSRAR